MYTVWNMICGVERLVYRWCRNGVLLYVYIIFRGFACLYIKATHDTYTLSVQNSQKLINVRSFNWVFSVPVNSYGHVVTLPPF